jgi:hypothetical protein
MDGELGGDELTFVAEAPELVDIVTRAAGAQGLATPADCDRWKRLVRQPRQPPRLPHPRSPVRKVPRVSLECTVLVTRWGLGEALAACAVWTQGSQHWV